MGTNQIRHGAFYEVPQELEGEIGSEFAFIKIIQSKNIFHKTNSVSIACEIVDGRREWPALEDTDVVLFKIKDLKRGYIITGADFLRLMQKHDYGQGKQYFVGLDNFCEVPHTLIDQIRDGDRNLLEADEYSYVQE